jgi:outer membrane lipase/esterase
MTLRVRLFSRVGAAAVAAFPLAVLSNTAHAQNFNQFIGFGDSTIDSGWWKAYFATNTTNGNQNESNLIKNALANGTNGAPVGAGNLNNSQILASLFGLTATPANQPGGTNYAIAGAVDAATAANGNIGNLNNSPFVNATNTNTGLPSTVQQIANYLSATGGHANPNALYLISSGGNDSTFANDAFGTVAQRDAYVTAQAQNLAAALTSLQAAGAQYIVVHYVGTSPVNTLNALQTQVLWSQLAANGVRFIPSDVPAVVAAAQFNPALFGFTPSTVSQGVVGTSTGSACVTQTGASATTSGWAQWCANTTTPSSSYAYLRSANSEFTSLYADNEHLSAAGQIMEADYDYSLVTAPSEMSYLAEAAVKTRTTLVDTIFQQISISERQRAVGTFNAWISGDISSLKMDNSFPGFPSDPGTPGMVTVGADYLLFPSWLVGGAVSAGTTTQSFSLGGNFRENEYALSGYAAYVGHPIWFDMIASYGGLHYNTNRVVPIGIATVSNTSSTSGDNASFAAEVGYNFISALGGGWTPSPMPTKAPSVAAGGLYITHGPVGGILLQKVDVNGFTESDPFGGDATGGFTALAFAGQVRDSAVTELGYQASTTLGIWQPYAKLVWNHELEPYNRLVTASLTTIAAPSFSLPAVVLGSDWGTATLGTSVTLRPGVTAYASFMSEFGESQATYYGGQIGLNVALGAPPPAPPLLRKD